MHLLLDDSPTISATGRSLYLLYSLRSAVDSGLAGKVGSREEAYRDQGCNFLCRPSSSLTHCEPDVATTVTCCGGVNSMPEIFSWSVLSPDAIVTRFQVTPPSRE